MIIIPPSRHTFLDLHLKRDVGLLMDGHQEGFPLTAEERMRQSE